MEDYKPRNEAEHGPSRYLTCSMAASLQLDLQSTGSCSVPETKTLNPKPKALNLEAFRCVCCMCLQGQTRRLKPRSYEVGAKVVPKNISFVETLHFIGYVQRRVADL